MFWRNADSSVVQRCLGMRSGLVAVSGRCLVHSQNGKRGEKGEEERKFVRNDQERQEARHSILPLRGGSFGGWCFVGLVVSVGSVFCGGGEF